MKFKEKLLILFVSVVVSVLGFNLMASSSVCLLTAAREAGNETPKNVRFYPKKSLILNPVFEGARMWSVP